MILCIEPAWGLNLTPDWTEADDEASTQLGWAIFAIVRDTDDAKLQVKGKAYGVRPYELRPIITEDIELSDDQAWEYVRSFRSTNIVRKAEAFLRIHSPIEANDIWGAMVEPLICPFCGTSDMFGVAPFEFFGPSGAIAGRKVSFVKWKCRGKECQPFYVETFD